MKLLAGRRLGDGQGQLSASSRSSTRSRGHTKPSTRSGSRCRSTTIMSGEPCPIHVFRERLAATSPRKIRELTVESRPLGTRIRLPISMCRLCLAPPASSRQPHDLPSSPSTTTTRSVRGDPRSRPDIPRGRRWRTVHALPLTNLNATGALKRNKPRLRRRPAGGDAVTGSSRQRPSLPRCRAQGPRHPVWCHTMREQTGRLRNLRVDQLVFDKATRHVRCAPRCRGVARAKAPSLGLVIEGRSRAGHRRGCRPLAPDQLPARSDGRWREPPRTRPAPPRQPACASGTNRPSAP